MVDTPKNAISNYPIFNEFVDSLGDECFYITQKNIIQQTICFVQIYESGVGAVIFLAQYLQAKN